MSARRRPMPILVAAVAALSITAAACSSGESAITAGNDDPTTAPSADAGDDAATATTDAGAPEETDPSTDATTGTDGTTDATTAGTEAPVTDPLADLPACPTDALDDVPDGGPVEITFWHGLNADNETALQAVVDGYHASQERVRIDLQNQGGYLETIDEYFQSRVESRPELVMFPEYAMQQAIDSASLIPSAACIATSGFDVSPLQAAIVGAYAAEGVQWGMPFNVSNPVLYYNRTMFEAAGLDPDSPPTSLAEVREVSQQLIDAGVATYGIALDSGLDNGGGWFFEQWMANAGVPIADNANGRAGRATEMYLDSPEAVELLTYVQELVDDGLAVYVGDNAGGSDTFLKLADPAQPAAMTIGTSAVIGAVVNALSGGLVEGFTPDDLGIGPLPGPTGEPSALVGGAAVYVVAGQGDGEAAAAWDFVTYLVSAELQSDWSARTGYLPIRDDALEIEPLASKVATDPRYRVAYDQLVARPEVVGAGPLLGPHRQIRSEMANAVAAILTGADVATTLAQANQLANAYLADYDANN